MSEDQEDLTGRIPFTYARSWVPAIRDYIEFKEDGAHCRIGNPDCKYIQKVFRPSNFVRHFQNEHTAFSVEKGFFRRCQDIDRPDKPGSSTASAPSKDHQTLAVERVKDFIVRREGVYYCNINPGSECSYQQKKFRRHYFLNHFLSRHPKRARELGFSGKRAKLGRALAVRQRPAELQTTAASDIDATVQKHIQLDGGKYLCRISAEFCFYFQTQFNSHNFYRHFYTVHAQEATENGISREKYLDLVNGPPQQQQEQELDATPSDPLTEKPEEERVMEQSMSVETMETETSSLIDPEAADSGSEDNSLIQVKQEVKVNQRMGYGMLHDLLNSCIRIEGDLTFCAINDGKKCHFYQQRFNATNFSRHIRNLHTEEAKQRGFFQPNVHRKYKRVSKIKISTNKIKEKKRNNQLRNMVNACVRHEGTIIYCQIDQDSNCMFAQKRYNPSNFSRHFRLKHPNEAEERGFFKMYPMLPTRQRSFREMVEGCVRHEGNLTYCEIDVNSKCSFVQKRYNPNNFKYHFLVKHAYEAEKKGFGKRSFRNNALPKRMVGVRVVDFHKLKLADKVLDFIVGRKSISGRTRYLCNIQPSSGCLYYEPLLHIGNRYRFANHFIRKHPDTALASGFEEAMQSNCDTKPDLPENPAPIAPEPDPQQQASPPKQKRKSVRSMVDELVIKEGVSATCNICPESGCTYSQKLYVPFNFVRHFYTKHSSAFVEHGFSFQEFLFKKSGKNTKEARNTTVEPPQQNVIVKEELDIDGFLDASGEGSFVIKQEIDEAMEVDDSLQIPAIKQEHDPLSEVDQCGEAANERIGIEEEDDYVENDSFSNIDSEAGSNGDLRYEFEYIQKVEGGFYCVIEDGKKCGYFQTDLSKSKFVQHFRNIHQEAAIRNGFFKENAEEAWRKKPFTFNRLKGSTEMVEECVREENHLTYCQINSESECTYRQANFNATNFARHFRRVHPVEAEERGFFELLNKHNAKNAPDGRRIRRSAQQSHRDRVFRNSEVTDEGVHCRIAGYCPYVQKKFMTSNFERHYRQKHPKEAMEKGFKKAHGEALTHIKKRIHAQKFDKLWKECVAKDEHGAYCRLVPGCTFFQRVFTKPRFRLHFFQNHNEEAIRKGFTEDFGRVRIPSEDQSESEKPEPLCPTGNLTFQRMVFECTAMDELGIRCRIDGTDNCPYSQNTFNLMDYLRHFRTVHTEEARTKRFFRTDDEERPRTFVLTSQIMEHVIPMKQGLQCAINPSEPCDFTKEKFASRDFLRHFCKYHPDEAEENGFMVEIIRSPVGANFESQNSNDGAGPSGMADSIEDEQEPIDEPFVDNPLAGGCELEVEDSRIMEQALTTPHEDPSTYCRLCFSVILPLQPIFASHGEDRTLAEQIAACAGLDLSAETEPSASVCCECVRKLDEIQHFRLLCHTLDRAVRGKAVMKKALTIDEGDGTTPDLPQGQPREDCVEGPSEIQIKYEQPAALDEDEDQTPPEVPIDQFQPAEALMDPGEDEIATDANRTFTCRECGEQLSWAHFMMQHRKEKHSSVTTPIKKNFKCPDCDTVMANRSKLAVHHQRYHNPDAAPKEKFYCTMPNCTNFYMSQTLLRWHIKAAHGITDPAQLTLMTVLMHS